MRFVQKAQARLRNEESGFTLIELLIVLVIIGILLAIAVPSYLGFKDRANNRAAQSDLRAAVPTAEAFFSDNNTYVGMTIGAMTSIDSAINPQIVPSSLTVSSYCLGVTVGGKAWSVQGPGTTNQWHKSADCSGAAQAPTGS